MRVYLKYVIALCFVGSLSLAVFPVLDIAIFDFSFMDMIKIILGHYASSQDEIWKTLSSIFQAYLKPYLIYLILWAALLIVGMLSCLLMKRKVLYRFLIPYECIVNVYTVTICILTIQKLKETEEALQFLNINFHIGVHTSTAISWFLLSLFIILFSMLGMYFERAKNIKDQEVMPELYDSQNNPWDIHHDITEYVPRETTLAQNDKSSKKQDVDRVDKDFTGALIGTGNLYHDFVYPLSDKVEVFFHDYKDHMEVEEYKNVHTIMGIYFIPEYQEYCIIPYVKKCVYLKSGQPLGQQRSYYVPRGTEFYLNQPRYSFRLG